LRDQGHVVVAWKVRQKQYTFENQGLSSHSEKKVRFFGILSRLKILSKSNDVHAHNNFFLAVRNELLLLLKIRITEGGDVTFMH
jgi:hypothetical protein